MNEAELKEIESKLYKSIEQKFKRKERALLKKIAQNEKTLSAMDKKIKRIEQHLKKNDADLSEALYSAQTPREDLSGFDIEKIDAFR